MQFTNNLVLKSSTAQVTQLPESKTSASKVIKVKTQVTPHFAILKPDLLSEKYLNIRGGIYILRRSW